MAQAEYAIIGGTGVYDASLLENPQEHTLETEYGTASCTIGTYNGKRIAFMPRHGKKHNVPPHQINYKANIAGLAEIGVRQIFATAAVGSLRLALPPGALVIVDQFLDFTKSRPSTFFENGKPVTHTDMTDPYCGRLRKHLNHTAVKTGIPITFGGTYVCTEGPRFESPAEIRMYSQFGGDVVGMTSIPETVLAKEIGLCYTCVGMVTNFCAGMTGAPLTHQEVLDEMAKNVHTMRKLFFNAIESLEHSFECVCPSAAGTM